MATNAQIKNFVRNFRIEQDNRNNAKFATLAGVSAALENYTDTAGLSAILANYALQSDVTSAIAGAYNYKGTVANFADLPATNNHAGDIYNITNAGGTDRNGNAIEAGVNVAYVEDEQNPGWDALGGITDISNKVDKVEGKQLSTNDYTDADKLLLGSLSASMDTDFTNADLTYVFTDDEP